MMEVLYRENKEPRTRVCFESIDQFVRGFKTTGQFTWAEIDHVIGAEDGFVPVIYGHLLLFEVRVTRLQEIYPCQFHLTILTLIFHWGCHNFGALG